LFYFIAMLHHSLQNTWFQLADPNFLKPSSIK